MAAFARSYFDLADAPCDGEAAPCARCDAAEPPPAPPAPPLQRVASALRRGVVGAGAALRTPFGPRRMAYADWAASGRALAPVEDFLRRCARLNRVMAARPGV